MSTPTPKQLTQRQYANSLRRVRGCIANLESLKEFDWIGDTDTEITLAQESLLMVETSLKFHYYQQRNNP